MSKMSSQIKTIFICLFLAAVIVGSSTFKEPRRGTSFNGTFYFEDTSVKRDWEAALAYCKQEDGELAKITSTAVYNILKIYLSDPGVYWVDGKDRPDVDRFLHSDECTSDGLDFSGIPGDKLKHLPRYCLAITKVAGMTSKIQAQSCFMEPTGVICSIPHVGCTSMTTVSP